MELSYLCCCVCFHADSQALKLIFSLISELKSMGTQLMSVEKLSSGVVKLCWIWHGKIVKIRILFLPSFSHDASFDKYRNRSIAWSMFGLVAGWRTQSWVMLWKEYRKKRRMKKNPKSPTLTAQKILMVGNIVI